MVNYGLLIQKRYHRQRWRRSVITFSILFSVVDLDNGLFPFNYICDLPKQFRGSNFCKHFREPITGLAIAKGLLEKAEKEYTDPDIHN